MNSNIVVYKDRTVDVSNPTDFPDVTDASAGLREIQEPVVKASIIVPEGSSTQRIFSSVHSPLDLFFPGFERANVFWQITSGR